MKQHEQTLQKYIFKREKPTYSTNNYTIWQANQKQTNLPVTIKLIKHPHIELPKYLKKLKEIRSDFVIKIFELVSDSSSLLLVTQQVTYGTLRKGLSVCEHLDQNDSVFVARVLLNGHVDMLREDFNWFGTEEDIQFTDSGIKLSWNNSCQYNLVNPFPNILSRLATRTEALKGNSLLPFPQVKGINELIKVSKENASEISLHPQMKQKIKLSKKKGKNWMGLRQVKGKNQYFDQLTFFAVSSDYGFVRVKMYDFGKISPNLLALNKTKNTFTRVLNLYDEGEKTYIISEYANDGNLQNYIKRLKANAMTLKEDQIQFFFFSLFEPIKAVQQSTLKSINMLHIKNVYIENGIPKIGQPIPINQKINQILADRADVPDFYHSQFKKDPTSRNVVYDTYSLGVLLYKLMYTEYPIFPNSKVHIPTTPNYNKRLKTTLQTFLNEGGSLAELQKRIQVSETVVKQVQENKERLIQNEGNGLKKQKKIKRQEQIQSEDDKPDTESKISLVEQEKQKQSVQSIQDDDQQGCWNTMAQKIKLDPAQKLKQTLAFVDVLEESPYRKCRIWSKIILVLILYIFMFYFQYLSNNVALLSDRTLLQKFNVTISGTNYQVVTSNYINFDQKYSSTSKTVASLQGDKLWCAVDSYQGNPVYSDTANGQSNSWLVYILMGLACLIYMILVKVIQMNLFDEIRALYFRQNGKGKFNVTNFIVFHLFWQTLLAGHFFLFNFIYYVQTDPCLGFPHDVQYGSTAALFSDKSVFMSVYAAVYIAQLIISTAHLVIIGLNQNMPYNRVVNPLTIFGGAFFIFFLILRMGAIMSNRYYPSAANDPHNIISGIFSRGELIGILGVFPQLLLLIEITIFLLVDAIFWGLLDKSHSLLSNQHSVANIDGLNELV